MLEFLTASQNIPFAVAAGLLLLSLAAELIGLLLGADVSSMIGDGGISDIAEAGLDSAGSGMGFGFVTSFLYWLNIGRVPLVILLIVFLTFFSAAGYVLQYVFFGAAGSLLPGYIAAPAAFFASLPAVRWSGHLFARIIPRDETEALSQDQLVGSRAVITIGTAKTGSPAQARTCDHFGTTHYVMVEPDIPEEQLEAGRELLLVRCEGSRFYAILHPDSV